MFRFRYSFKSQFYSASLSREKNTPFRPKSAIKLDTGASNTVISVKSLLEFGIINENDIPHIIHSINSSDTYATYYKSATGHSLAGFPCHLKNIFLSNELIEDFYFHIILNDTDNINLLGADFIRFCQVRKEVNNAFELYNLDTNLYKLSFLRAVKTSKLLNLDDITTVKDLAAYFRSYYKED